MAFRDHHAFTKHELESIARAAQSLHAVVVTTEKDWIRLAASADSSVVFANVDVRVVRVEMRLRRDRPEFERAVMHGM